MASWQLRTLVSCYGYLPSLRINQSGVFQGSSVGAGFQVGFGQEDTPKHLGEIGLLGFALNPRQPLPRSSNGLSTEFALGYLYHWSTDYKKETPSHNIHVGVGYVSVSWRQNRTEDANVAGMTQAQAQAQAQERRVTSVFGGSGLYARFAYFFSTPLKKYALITGLSLTWKMFSNGRGAESASSSSGSAASEQPATTTTNSSRQEGGFAVQNLQPAQLNSFDLSFIVGIRF